MGSQTWNGDGVTWGRLSAEMECLVDAVAGARLLSRRMEKRGPVFEIATLGKVR